MRHSNISIFIPHIGCPHQCSFCDQRTISGAQHAPSGDEVREICEKALREVSSPENSEIAFFGGSFTAISRDYMTELLEAAQPFIGVGKFRGIRISTRPDCIDREVLDLLKISGVTAIELGAQSMNDDVLMLNKRGHTAEGVENACGLIREYGFETGLQMMLGLYGSTSESDLETAAAILNLHPDTVRIYPVVILKGTRLAQLYESGKYKPYPFEKAVEISADTIMMFENSGIRVIKCGLHASEFVERDMIGGFYHPAFRELCESEIYRKKMSDILSSCGGKITGTVVFAAAKSCISKAMGHKKSNIEYFRKNSIEIKIIGDDDVPKYDIKLRR